MSESFWGAFNVVNALASLFVFVIGAGMLVALVPPFWTPFWTPTITFLDTHN